MELTRTGRVGLDDPVARFFADWRSADRERITVGDLLEHASGLAARLIDAPPGSRREFEYEICRMPLESAPRSKTIYSDLGFILLGFLAADVGGAALSDLLDRIISPLDARPTFELMPDLKRLAAPTLPLSRTRGVAGCSRARCTTTTRRLSAAPRATQGSSVRHRMSEYLRAPCSAPPEDGGQHAGGVATVLDATLDEIDPTAPSIGAFDPQRPAVVNQITDTAIFKLVLWPGGPKS